MKSRIWLQNSSVVASRPPRAHRFLPKFWGRRAPVRSDHTADPLDPFTALSPGVGGGLAASTLPPRVPLLRGLWEGSAGGFFLSGRKQGSAGCPGGWSLGGVCGGLWEGLREGYQFSLLLEAQSYRQFFSARAGRYLSLLLKAQNYRQFFRPGTGGTFLFY